MIVVNLFDYNFGPNAPCSVAYQVPKNVQYVREHMEYEGVTLFTDEYINSPVVDQVKSRYKIGWLHEPYCLHPQTYEHAWENRNKFSMILTYYEPFLSHRESPKKFFYCPYAGIWINRRDWKIVPKTRNISMLFGEKFLTRGHQIRHEIHDALGDRYGIDYFGKYGTSTDYSAETKLQVLRDYHFSIVIETCREEGLFTEILLDSLAVGTIPIFWGAPDISKYFDPNGILSFETIGELVAILDALEGRWQEVYQRMFPYVGKNFLEAEKYAVTEDWIYAHYIAEDWLYRWFGR